MLWKHQLHKSEKKTTLQIALLLAAAEKIYMAKAEVFICRYKTLYVITQSKIFHRNIRYKKLLLSAIANSLSLIEIKKVVKCHRLWLLKLLIQCLYKLEMCTGIERSAIEKELFFQFLVFFKANPIFQKTNFLVAQTKWGNVAKLLLYCFKTHNCSMHSTLNI